MPRGVPGSGLCHSPLVIAELEKTLEAVANEIAATEKAVAGYWTRLLVP